MVDSVKMRRPPAIVVMIALLAILAFLGFFSGFSFITDPSGGSHGMDTSILEGNTPIEDFMPVGVFFVLAYGFLPVAAIVGLWKQPRARWTDAFNKWTGQNWAWSATLATGVLLIIWIAVEVAMIGSPPGFPRFLQIMMALFGVVFVGLCMLPGVRAFTRLAN